MTYQPPPSPYPPAATAAEYPARKRRRTWPWLVGGAVVLVVVIAVAANAGSNGTISNSPGQAGQPAAAQPQAPTTATWGQRYTWPGGIAVGMSQPVPFQPSDMAAAISGPIQRAVAFTIQVTNGSKTPYDFNPFIMDGSVQFNGADANEITDLDGQIGTAAETTILPGHSYSYKVGYSVAPTKGSMQFEFTESAGGTTAVFTGSA